MSENSILEDEPIRGPVCLLVEGHIWPMSGRELAELRAALHDRFSALGEQLEKRPDEAVDKRVRTGLAALSRITRTVDGVSTLIDPVAERQEWRDRAVASAKRQLGTVFGHADTRRKRRAQPVSIEAAHGPKSAVNDGKESSK